MEKDCWRTLKSSLTYGYVCRVFKHNICGDQLEVPNGKPDSPNFLSPECFVSLRCPPVLASFEDTATGVHRREVAEEPRRGARLRDLNGTFNSFSSSFSSFLNGPNMAALILPHFFRSGPLDIYLHVTNDAIFVFIRNNFL